MNLSLTLAGTVVGGLVAGVLATLRRPRPDARITVPPDRSFQAMMKRRSALGLLVVLASLATAACGDGDDEKESAAVAAAGSTTLPTTSTSAVAPPSTSPGTTQLTPVTTTAGGTAQGTVLTTAVATLKPAPQPTVFFAGGGADADCRTLVEAGWTIDCGRVDMAGGSRTWVVQTRATGTGTEARAAVVHWSQARGAWLSDVTYRSTSFEVQTIKVRAADLTGDGKSELVFGFHRTGSGSILTYDIVGDSVADGPVVLAARDLSHGRATVEPGKITDYQAAYPNNEPNCCPAYVQVSTVTYATGSFRAVATTRVPPATGPSTSPNDG